MVVRSSIWIIRRTCARAPRKDRPRCHWCKRFVARGTPLTAWKVKVGYRGGSGDNQQNPRSHWNYCARLLCPDCVRCLYFGSWKRVTVAEVHRRYTRGWNPERPGLRSA
jgi:hypothetical protein